MEMTKEKTLSTNDYSARSDSSDNVREKQVAFTLSLDGDNGTVLAKTAKRDSKSRKRKKWRNPRYTLPDATSWPSDSDITVLRMKLCLNDLKERISIPGDGLHQPDASSMVNLATLVMQSKPNLCAEEYLMPLSSWGQEQNAEVKGQGPDSDRREASCPPAAVSSAPELKRRSQVSLVSAAETLKSKLAWFLRLYFCSCCKCLYNLENKNDSDLIFDETIDGK